MIIEESQTTECAVTAHTFNDPSLLIMIENLGDFQAAVYTVIVCPTVTLCMGTELAVGVGAGIGLASLFGRGICVLGAHVELECLALEKSLLTNPAGMRHLLFVAFHVVVHGVLLLLGYTAGGADEMTGLVPNVLAHFQGVNRWGQLRVSAGAGDSIFASGSMWMRRF